MYRFKLYHEAAGELELEHAPVGWDALEFTVKRGQMHGMTLDFTGQLDFVKEGFDFIHTVYEVFGVEAQVLLFVYEASRLGFHYELVYAGQVALEGWRVQDFPRQGTANVDLASFTHRFLNRLDVDVDLTALTGLDGAPMATMPLAAAGLHSQGIVQGYDARATVESTTLTYVHQDNFDMPRGQHAVFGFNEVVSNELGFNTYGTTFVTGPTENWQVYEAKVTGTIALDLRLVGMLKGTAQNGTYTGIDWEISYRKNGGAPVVLHTAYGQANNAEETYIDYDVSRSFSVAVVPGDRIYLLGRFYVQGADRKPPWVTPYRFTLQNFLYRDSFLKASASTTVDTGNNSRGVLLHEALARVTESITGYRNAFYSDFFGRTDSLPRAYPADGEGAGHLLLNGFWLRGFPIKGQLGALEPLPADATFTERFAWYARKLTLEQLDAKSRGLSVSFERLFKAADAVWCLGAGLERVNGELVVRVEPRQHFYRLHETAARLGRVAALSKSVAGELYVKEAVFGYREWKIEEENGLLEYNTRSAWTTPVTRSKNRYEHISEFVTSGYMIEKAKRDPFTLAESKDSRGDENLFLIALARQGEGWRSATTENVDATDGIAEPASAYNLRLTPRTMLHRHLPFLAASLYKMDRGLLFSTGEGNYRASYTVGSNTFAGGTDVLREWVPQPVYLPEEYEFECGLSQFQARSIRENPYALIRFQDHAGTEYAGFLLEMSHSPREKKGKFKLLRANI